MQKNLIDGSGFCFVCGGNGFVDKSCPSCGRKPARKSLNLEFSKDSSEFVSKIDSFGVPDAYRGVVWNSDILAHDKPQLQNDYNFTHYLNMMNKINDLFVDGVLSRKSAIIIAPAGYSKMIFAYSCMQRALDHGFSVAPLLDTCEVKRLLFLAAENPSYRLYKSIGPDEYIMSDVCFVTVTKSSQRLWAYEILQELLDKRTRKGLATFVLSRFDLSEISSRDRSNSFDAFMSQDVTDSCKYPAIIRYRPAGQ